MVRAIGESIQLVYETLPVVVYIFTFIFGAVIGSFLNVCIYRFPKHESIVIVPSHCMTCGKQLHWYELVPLFSFIIQGGKCRGCKTKLSPQYFIVECLTGVIFLGILLINGLSILTVLIQLMAAALLVISVVDARTFEIPLPCTITVGVLGVIRWAVYYKEFLGPEGVRFWNKTWFWVILGPIVMDLLFGLIILLSNGKAMGGGDYKLAIAAGIFLGLKGVFLGLVIGCIVGSVIHLTLMALKKKGRELAFGPYLSIGFLVSALWGNEIISWYVSKFFTM